MIAPTQVLEVLEVYPLSFSKPVPRCTGVCLEKGAYSGYQSTLCQSSPTRLIFIFLQIQPFSFAPDLKRLPDLPCICHTSASKLRHGDDVTDYRECQV